MNDARVKENGFFAFSLHYRRNRRKSFVGVLFSAAACSSIYSRTIQFNIQRLTSKKTELGWLYCNSESIEGKSNVFHPLYLYAFGFHISILFPPTTLCHIDSSVPWCRHFTLSRMLCTFSRFHGKTYGLHS